MKSSEVFRPDEVEFFPMLVLRESTDGATTGVWMREGDFLNVEVEFASTYAEPEEVDVAMAELEALEPGQEFMHWVKGGNIEADSLDSAIAAAPQSTAGQKEVLVYRESEWLDGLWNDPSKPDAYPLKLSSIADFHGGRVSDAKRRTRAGIEVARFRQTMPGDYGVIAHAVSLLKPQGPMFNCEEDAAVGAMCSWWNTNAPESMRPAACFRVYTWDETNGIFEPGDPEEPALQATHLSESPAYAIFDRYGHPTVAIQFYRGREFNTYSSQWGTETYYANGERASNIGMELEQVDEAYYSVIGLRRLGDELACRNERQQDGGD